MNKFGQTLIILLLGIAIGGTYHEDLQLAVNKLIGFTNSETISKVNQIELDGSKVKMFFTSSANCRQIIIDHINQAKNTIYMTTDGLTHPQIVDALMKATQRGVDVRILLDRSKKVVILDQRTTITGSFSVTAAADTRNTEDILIINDRNIAQNYLQNWPNSKAAN